MPLSKTSTFGNKWECDKIKNYKTIILFLLSIFKNILISKKKKKKRKRKRKEKKKKKRKEKKQICERKIVICIQFWLLQSF